MDLLFFLFSNGSWILFMKIAWDTLQFLVKTWKSWAIRIFGYTDLVKISVDLLELPKSKESRSLFPMPKAEARSHDILREPSSKFSLSFSYRDILISCITKKTTFSKFECSAKRETILYKIDSTLIVLLTAQQCFNKCACSNY